jgi:hypothetical protein
MIRRASLYVIVIKVVFPAKQNVDLLTIVSEPIFGKGMLDSVFTPMKAEGTTVSGVTLNAPVPIVRMILRFTARDVRAFTIASITAKGLTFGPEIANVMELE